MDALSRRYSTLLPDPSGPQFFADVLRYLGTTIPELYAKRIRSTGSDDWTKQPFFQIRLQSSRGPLHHRSNASKSRSEQGAALFKTTKANDPGYTVSYFGETFHKRSIMPTDALGKLSYYCLGHGAEKDLHPQHAMYTELLAHGLYSVMCNNEGRLLGSIRPKLEGNHYFYKTTAELLCRQLRNELGLTSAEDGWKLVDWPKDITVIMSPLDQAIFSAAPSCTDEKHKTGEVRYELYEGSGLTRRTSSLGDASAMPSYSLENSGPRYPRSC